MKRSGGSGPRGLLLVRRPTDPAGTAELQRRAAGAPPPISDVVPALGHFGLRVLSGRSEAQGRGHLQHFTVDGLGPASRDARLAEAIAECLEGRAEDDGYNRLVASVGCTLREVQWFRALCRYLAQVGITPGAGDWGTLLSRHAAVVEALLRRQPLRRLEPLLAAVGQPEEERLLRCLAELSAAIVRSNAADRDGPPLPALALKLAPRDLSWLPSPRPLHEIWVHGARLEGVHLRMADVARGGIRWSERPADFRAEVLGLMKTQHVKNAVIVPQGAKGGFVLRRPPAGRSALQAEGIAAYELFINALLDVTDDLGGPDPYLVVAADKGTARFSDRANAIALRRGFWLGDAFASGGSVGYDHKALGITARGAWECVTRHFAEMGRDISREEFTVAGIGDMSGDVFGNGMLLSPHIRLVAAFDHRHVFLDPAPDAARSLEERRRLAALPGSSWADYDRSLLSPGGGVHERGARRIALTAEVKALLQAAELQDRSEATPDELVRAILRMPVDLLWNGGIGTYVKASTESHADAQDRGNDSVRVDGAALRARVVGEGGNLGFTQRGRIEYALAGGRINTDSIDNSAGVNTSDIEVNLKILLGTRRSRQRDALLRRITPDVVRQVLRTNRLQGAALSLAERDVAQRPATWQALIRHLVRNEGLDPRLERLPTEDELAERRRKGRALTRPELAVLMSWQKLALQRQLLASRLPEDPHFAVELERYFPAAAVRAAGRRLAGHRLRREIIATVTANTLVNHMGPTFPLLMAQATGADAADIARAYTLVREALQLRDLWDALESPAHALPMAARYEAAAEGIELTRHLCSSLLRLAPHSELADLSAALRRLRGPLAQLAAGAGQWCRGEELAQLRRREAHFAALGLPADLTARVAALEVLKPAPELLRLARGSRRTITEVAGLHAELGAQLGLDWLRHRTLQLDDSDPWQAAAVDALQDVQWHLQARATARALQRRDGWRPRTQDMDAWQQQREALQAMATPTLAALAVGTDSVRRLLSRPA